MQSEPLRQCDDTKSSHPAAESILCRASQACQDHNSVLVTRNLASNMLHGRPGAPPPPPALQSQARKARRQPTTVHLRSHTPPAKGQGQAES
eukprot:3067441-Alexandrium_andersonii.AAC.1